QADAQRTLLKLLEDRHAAGSVAITEVSPARTALLRTESALVDAHNQELAARAKVAAALGLSTAALGSIALPHPPAGSPLSEAELLLARKEALQHRADILIALAKYRSVQTALELEIERRIPDFHVGPGYQWDQGSNKWMLSVSFELPLFHGNET